MTKWKVYISSTFRDLHEFRAELRSYFEKQLKDNFELCKIMEKMFDDGTFTPFAEECIKEVENCDIYILILGNKVGSFPPDESRTYTEIELTTAIKNDKKIFCFILDHLTESEIDNKEKHQEILNNFSGRPTHPFSDIPSLKLAFLESLIQFGASSPIKNTNPYKGLAAFNVEDGNNFFGRGQEIEDCLKKIVTNDGNTFISVIGNSGIGKTSFAQAGILYSLKNNVKYGFQDFRQIIVTPGSEPYSNFKYQLHINDIDFAEFVYTGRFKEKIVIFFNQFEEVITQCHDEKSIEERGQLFKFLDSAVTSKTNNKNLVIITTFRTDYLSQLANFDFIKNMQTYFPLSSLDYNLNTTDWEASMIDIITNPALNNGVKIENELTKQLMNEIKEVDGSLSILQFALQKLWNEDTIKDRKITLAEYSNLSAGKGIEGIIEAHAQNVIDEILRNSNNVKETEGILKTIFLSLVEVTDSTLDVRKTISKAELFEKLVIYPAQQSTNAFEYLISEKSRLITVYKSKDEAVNVDIIHEVLIRKWNQLKQWINEKRNALKYQKWIEVEVNKAKKGDVGRYRGRRLEEAIVWRKNNPELLTSQVDEFINNSTRHVRNMKIKIVAIPIILFILIAIFYNPYQRWSFTNNIPDYPSLYEQVIASGGSIDSIKTLKIDASNYIFLKDKFHYFKSVTHVIVDADNFDDLSLLDNLDSLKSVTISKNLKLRDLKAFSNLTSIKKITLINNPNLASLSGIEKLVSLDSLFLLRNHNLKNLKGLKQENAVKFLEISGSDILFNLGGILNFKSLNSLYLEYAPSDQSSPQISPLSLFGSYVKYDHNTPFRLQEIKNLKSLSSLKIAANYFLGRGLKLDLDSIQVLKSLKILEISGVVNVKDLKNLGQLNNLSSLNIDLNDSVRNTDWLQTLNSLTSLKMTGNLNLNGIQNLPLLEELSISGNMDLNNFSYLENLNNLVQLEISENKILKTCQGIEKLKSLKTLIISDNSNLTNLTGISELKSLTSLALYDNDSLKNIQQIKDLKSLSHLTISQNQIINLNGIKTLGSLKVLNISTSFTQNDLYEIFQVKSLTNLYISDNDSIQNLNGIEQLTSLQTLKLRFNNRLNSIKGMGSIKALSSILITSRLLYVDMSEIYKMQNLKDVTVSGNIDVKYEKLREKNKGVKLIRF